MAETTKNLITKIKENGTGDDRFYFFGIDSKNVIVENNNKTSSLFNVLKNLFEYLTNFLETVNLIWTSENEPENSQVKIWLDTTVNPQNDG